MVPALPPVGVPAMDILPTRGGRSRLGRRSKPLPPRTSVAPAPAPAHRRPCRPPCPPTPVPAATSTFPVPAQPAPTDAPVPAQPAPSSLFAPPPEPSEPVAAPSSLFTPLPGGRAGADAGAGVRPARARRRSHAARALGDGLGGPVGAVGPVVVQPAGSRGGRTHEPDPPDATRDPGRSDGHAPAARGADRRSPRGTQRRGRPHDAQRFPRRRRAGPHLARGVRGPSTTSRRPEPPRSSERTLLTRSAQAQHHPVRSTSQALPRRCDGGPPP